MRKLQIVVCAVASGAALLTACGESSKDEATQSVTSEAPVRSATNTRPSTSAPVTRPVLGQSQTTRAGVKATPFTLENPTSREPDSDFARYEDPRPWSVLDAELCAGSAELAKTGYGFTLTDAQNREYKSLDSTLQPFEPVIDGGDLAPNECARGFVNFEIPAGVQIVAVRWDYPGGGGPLRWALQ